MTKSMSPGQNARERIVWLDSLKGLTVALVVLGHIAQGTLEASAFGAGGG